MTRLVLLIVIGMGALGSDVAAQPSLLQSFDFGSFIETQEVVDLDGDPWPDLIYTAVGSAAVHVAHGSISGFGAPESLSVGFQPSAIAASDRTGDGVRELVIARFQPSTLFVYGASPSGWVLVDSFDPGGAPSALASADFDLDGWEDLAVGIQTTGGLDVGRVAVFFGGVSTPPPSLEVREDPVDIVVEDVT
ncbi:MAG: VCBS repeat-containing protein, partial [Planctomycetes bacterium]|nr:VCBS repeat-containing protein [Planctomycetota bacterium]